MHIGYSVKAEEWDDEKKQVRKSHPNSVRLNNLISQRLAEINNTKLQLETEKPEITVRSIREKIKPSIAPTFFPQAQDYLNDLKMAGKYNPYTSDKPRITHFKQFLQNRDIAFVYITPRLLDKFAVWLKHAYKPKGKKKKRLSDRSIINLWVTIRSVFTHAGETRSSARIFRLSVMAEYRSSFPIPSKFLLSWTSWPPWKTWN